jgi:mannitol-1-phosphate 5-dehydrogenase
MLQSAAILRTAYPEEFSASELEVHIDDLIYRFRNKALRDTIFRVGQDLVRKLGPDDRFVGIIRLAQKLNLPINKILRAMAFAFSFKALDENGNRCEQDILFDNHLINGIESALQNVCGFDSVTDKDLIEEFKYQYVAHQ